MPATLQNPGEHIPLDDTYVFDKQTRSLKLIAINVLDSMGSMLIGVIVSAILFGISVVQTLYYYSRE